MHDLGSDLRVIVRGLLHAPVFTVVVVTTLALGIGANTAIFSIVNAVLIEPLGYEDPDALVRFHGTRGGEPTDSGTISYPNFIDIRERSNAFVSAAAYDEWRTNLTGTGQPERLEGAAVNVEYFDVLGVQPALGRFFLAEEDVDGQDAVVVLSHGLWQRRFGGDEGLIGSSILLNGNPHTIVGVAPRDFEDPMLSGVAWGTPALWRPLGYFGLEPDRVPSRGSSSYTAIARLAPGVTLEAARAEVAALSDALERQYPNNNEDRGHTLMPLRDTIVADSAASLLLMLGAVACVLAIATVNVASLMMSRATDRSHETALRLALGAGRMRLLQGFLLEGLLLSAFGGLLGIALGPQRQLVPAFGRGRPRSAGPRLHGRGQHPHRGRLRTHAADARTSTGPARGAGD